MNAIEAKAKDHIELFFSAVRSKGGFNNNPTASQFVAAYKRLVVHNQVKGGRGNCTCLDDTRILYMSSHIGAPDELDVTTAKTNGTNDSLEIVDFFEESELECLPLLSIYVANIAGYIAGFVCRMVQRRITCSACQLATVS